MHSTHSSRILHEISLLRSTIWRAMPFPISSIVLPFASTIFNRLKVKTANHSVSEIAHSAFSLSLVNKSSESPEEAPFLLSSRSMVLSGSFSWPRELIFRTCSGDIGKLGHVHATCTHSPFIPFPVSLKLYCSRFGEPRGLQRSCELINEQRILPNLPIALRFYIVEQSGAEDLLISKK